MLDTCSAATMSSPRCVSHDPCAAKHGRDELGDAAVAAVRKDATMVPAEAFDLRSTIVNHIVAVAGPASSDRDHRQVGTTDEQLRVTGPTILATA